MNTNCNAASKAKAGCRRIAVLIAVLVPGLGCWAGEGAPGSPFAAVSDPSGCRIERITVAEHEQYQVQGASASGELLLMTTRRAGAEEDDQVLQVSEMDLSTGAQRELPTTLTNSGPYSPDGRYNVIAQVSDDGKTDIYEYERTSATLRPIAAHPAWDWLPSYSPDGRMIVFNSYRVDGQSDVHLYDRSSGELRRLTVDPGYDAHAQFSSDGQRIVFHRQQGSLSDGGAIFNLYVHDLSSGQERQLTDGAHESSYPAWAPDGRHLVYSSDADGKPGKHNLYILNPKGETVGRLTEGDWKDSYAYWTQDGRHIYFNSDREGVGKIYRIPMNGLACVRLDD